MNKVLLFLFLATVGAFAQELPSTSFTRSWLRSTNATDGRLRLEIGSGGITTNVWLAPTNVYASLAWTNAVTTNAARLLVATNWSDVTPHALTNWNHAVVSGDASVLYSNTTLIAGVTLPAGTYLANFAADANALSQYQYRAALAINGTWQLPLSSTVGEATIVATPYGMGFSGIFTLTNTSSVQIQVWQSDGTGVKWSAFSQSLTLVGVNIGNNAASVSGITNNQTGITLSGTFIGDGAALTGIKGTNVTKAAAFANTLYVRTNGTDASAVRGDPTRPWATFGLAVSNAVAGDTVSVGPGVYYEPTQVWMPEHVAVIGEPGNRIDFGANLSGGALDGALTVINDNQFYNLSLNLTNGYAWILVGDPEGSDRPGTNVLFQGCTIQGRSDNFMLLWGLADASVPYSLTVNNCELTSGWDFLADLYWTTTNGTVKVINSRLTGDNSRQRGPDFTPNGQLNLLHNLADLAGGSLEWADVSVTVLKGASDVSMIRGFPAGTNNLITFKNVSFDVQDAPAGVSTPATFLALWNASPGKALNMQNVSWRTGGVWQAISSGLVTAERIAGDGSGLTNLSATNVSGALLASATAPFDASKTVVMFVGDSKSSQLAGYMRGLPWWSSVAVWTNCAIPGATNQMVYDSWSSSNNLVSSRLTGATNGIAILWSGHNDYTVDPETTYGIYSNLMTELVASNWNVTVVTPQPRKDGGLDFIPAWNAQTYLANRFRGAWQAWRIADAAAQFGNCYDTNLFYDGVHLASEGQTNIARLVDSVVRSPKRPVPILMTSTYGTNMIVSVINSNTQTVVSWVSKSDTTITNRLVAEKTLLARSMDGTFPLTVEGSAGVVVLNDTGAFGSAGSAVLWRRSGTSKWNIQHEGRTLGVESLDLLTGVGASVMSWFTNLTVGINVTSQPSVKLDVGGQMRSMGTLYRSNSLSWPAVLVGAGNWTVDNASNTLNFGWVDYSTNRSTPLVLSSNVVSVTETLAASNFVATAGAVYYQFLAAAPSVAGNYAATWVSNIAAPTFYMTTTNGTVKIGGN